MINMRSITTYVILAAAAISAVAAVPAAGGDENEAKLIGVLTSKAPPQEKAVTCKRLAIFGSKAAVPALAPLLADKDLASWARIALEAIPGPEADEALRKAVGSLKGNLLIGAINSIGVRRDAKAVDLLIAKLEDTDAAGVAGAAAAIAPAAPIDRVDPRLAGRQAIERPMLGSADFHAFLAIRTDLAEQALRQRRPERSGDQVGLYADVEQPGHGARCVVGVQSGEDQMPGKRRLRGD